MVLLCTDSTFILRTTKRISMIKIPILNQFVRQRAGESPVWYSFVLVSAALPDIINCQSYADSKEARIQDKREQTAAGPKLKDSL